MVVNSTAGTSQPHLINKGDQQQNGVSNTATVDFQGLLFGARPSAMPTDTQSQQQSATQEHH